MIGRGFFFGFEGNSKWSPAVVYVQAPSGLMPRLNTISPGFENSPRTFPLLGPIHKSATKRRNKRACCNGARIWAKSMLRNVMN